MDPSYPDTRIAFMLEDSGATAVVTSLALASRLPENAPSNSNSNSNSNSPLFVRLCVDDSTVVDAVAQLPGIGK